MIIEFSGPPGAGKTRLCSLLAQRVTDQGLRAINSREIALMVAGQSAFGRWVHRRAPKRLRPVLIKLAALCIIYVHAAGFAFKHAELIREVVRVPFRRHSPWPERRLLWKRVLFNAGNYELFRRRRRPEEVLLMSEGFTHRACGLYRTHAEDEPADSTGVAGYIGLTPPVDLTIGVQAPLEVCLERISERSRRPSPLMSGVPEARLRQIVASAAEVSVIACQALRRLDRPVVEIENGDSLDAARADLSAALDSLMGRFVPLPLPAFLPSAAPGVPNSTMSASRVESSAKS